MVKIYTFLSTFVMFVVVVICQPLRLRLQLVSIHGLTALSFHISQYGFEFIIQHGKTTDKESLFRSFFLYGCIFEFAFGNQRNKRLSRFFFHTFFRSFCTIDGDVLWWKIFTRRKYGGKDVQTHFVGV
jgi:hypothetical protein